jgi:hypothetical protein
MNVDRDDRAELLEAGKWLRAKRQETGASTLLVARLATLLANRQGDPVRIHQQQLSEIENARPGRGPLRLRPWFRHVRAAFDSGLIADALGTQSSGTPAKLSEDPVERTYSIVDDATGEVVGRLNWFGRVGPVHFLT